MPHFRNRRDPSLPVAFFVEPERSEAGEVVDVATVFLTNRQCPFACLMCDLWKDTLAYATPAGAIPRQIDVALGHLPPARQIKLYNSGNFFDRKAIPPADHPAIAARIAGFERVVVENHPKLCTPDVLRFRDRIPGQLEVAIGLETSHPETLARLNKSMTLDDVRRAVDFLVSNQIRVRAFLLLRPPYTSEAEGVDQAIQSIAFAFSIGVACCVIIPTRAGTDAMDRLQERGVFAPPRLRSLEHTLEAGLALRRGRVFADVWDVERIFECATCGPARQERLRRMNLGQHIEPPVHCAADCQTGSA